MYKKIILLFIVITLIPTIVISDNSKNDRVVAEIIEITKTKGEDNNSNILKVKILEGKYKNKLTYIKYERIVSSSFDFDLSVGDKILIDISVDENTRGKTTFINVWRLSHIKVLGIIFLVVLIIFGRLKGLLSLTSLLFSGFIIIKCLIPLIIKGYNPIVVSIVCSSIIIIVSFILIAGFTKKSLVAVLGTLGGTFSAGIISYIYSKLCIITGLADENVMFLVTNLGIEIDFRGLYMGAVIVGTIGVVMDVSMSITSVIFEIKKKNPQIRGKELFQSGLTVGKDVMATMVNTLVLAYVGSFMPVLISYVYSEVPMKYALNTELISVEIIRSLCGSIGLILTIPLTCIFAVSSVLKKK